MMQTSTSLIIGSDGALGSALKKYLVERGEQVIESTRRRDTCSANRIFLDLSNEIDDSWSPPPGVSVVYICAAVASLEKCLADPDASARVNVNNTVTIARECMENGLFVIFPSTNLVFDGSAPSRKIGDLIFPKTEYGRQKAEAEKQLQVCGGNNLAIVRFTKIITPGFPLILQWIQSLKSNQVIHPFSDYVMAPVSSPLAVECLYRIAHNRMQGIFHLSAPGDISYADMGFHLAQKLDVSSDLVVPIKIKDSGIHLENIPEYTSLDITDTEKRLGIKIPDGFSTIDRMFLP